MDQASAHTTIPIDERMDGLELGVHDGGLSQRRNVISLEEHRDVLEQRSDLLGRRRYELGIHRTVQATAQPVLDLAEPARRRIGLGSHERCVDGFEIVHGDR